MLRSFKLKLEPYDPDAKDGDGDGIVQEGTAWERPAGTRILDEFGTEIGRGNIRTQRPRNIRIVDRNNNNVDYTPTYQQGEAGQQQEEASNLGSPSLTSRGLSTLGSRSPTIGERIRSARTPPPPPPPEPEEIVTNRRAIQDSMSIVDNIWQNAVNTDALPEGPQQKEAFLALVDAYSMYLNTSIPDAAFAARDATPEQAAAARQQLLERIQEHSKNILEQKTYNKKSKEIFQEATKINNRTTYLAGLNDIVDSTSDLYTNAELLKSINDASGILVENMDDETLQRLKERFDLLLDKQATDEMAANYPLEQHRRLFNWIAESIRTNLGSSSLKERKEEIDREIRNRSQEEILEPAPPTGLLPGAAGYGVTKPKNPSLGPLGRTPDELVYPFEEIYIRPGENGAPTTPEESAQALLNGTPLSEIPNEHLKYALENASSGDPFDPNTPFYRVEATGGAYGDTWFYFARDKNGNATKQGVVLKGEVPSVAARDRFAWNMAVALGMYPEGSRGDGKGAIPPGKVLAGEQAHYYLIPMVWNHLVDGTADANSREGFITAGRFDELEYLDLPDRALNERLIGHLHGWYTASTDRHPGNILTVRDPEGRHHHMPIDFGLPGGEADQLDGFGYYVNIASGDFPWFRDLEGVLNDPNKTQREKDRIRRQLIDTFENVVARAEQLAENFYEEDMFENLHLEEGVDEMWDDYNAELRRSRRAGLEETHKAFLRRVEMMRNARDTFLEQIELVTQES
jgi:hypothetical protein